MWPFRKKIKRTAVDFRIIPTTQIGSDHYILEYRDDDKDFYFGRVVSKGELSEFLGKNYLGPKLFT